MTTCFDRGNQWFVDVSQRCSVLVSTSLGLHTRKVSKEEREGRERPLTAERGNSIEFNPKKSEIAHSTRGILKKMKPPRIGQSPLFVYNTWPCICSAFRSMYRCLHSISVVCFERSPEDILLLVVLHHFLDVRERESLSVASVDRQGTIRFGID